MPWVKITAQHEETDEGVGEAADWGEEALPEPLRFYIRDLTVGEAADYRERVREMMDEATDVQDVGEQPDEDDEDAMALYRLREARAAQKLTDGLEKAQRYQVEIYVREFDGYESINDLPDYYLPAVIEKVQDFLAGRRTLSWTLDVGTRSAKPSKGRK